MANQIDSLQSHVNEDETNALTIQTFGDLKTNCTAYFFFNDTMKKYVYISYSDQYQAFIIYLLNEKDKRSSNDIDTFIRKQAKEIREKE